MDGVAVCIAAVQCRMDEAKWRFKVKTFAAPLRKYIVDLCGPWQRIVADSCGHQSHRLAQVTAFSKISRALTRNLAFSRLQGFIAFDHQNLTGVATFDPQAEIRDSPSWAVACKQPAWGFAHPLQVTGHS